MISKELGNNLEKCKNNETLQQILTNATIMVVSVTASTTQGWAHTYFYLHCKSKYLHFSPEND